MVGTMQNLGHVLGWICQAPFAKGNSRTAITSRGFAYIRDRPKDNVPSHRDSLPAHRYKYRVFRKIHDKMI